MTSVLMPLTESDHRNSNTASTILQGLSVGIVGIDSGGKILLFNKEAENITGLSAHEVLGNFLGDVSEKILGMSAGKAVQSILANPIDFEIESQISRSQKDVSHVNCSVRHLETDSPENIGIILTLQNITRTKKLEELAGRNGRLTAMGEMAAKITHEIRNPLGSIELFSSLLSRELQGFADLKKFAEHICSGVRNINTIISNLMLFVRTDSKPDLRPVNIHEVIKDSLFFVEHQIAENDAVDVRIELFCECLTVNGDAELLKQVLLNLILNALQAMSHSGVLTIRSHKIHHPLGLPTAEIRILDTGCGIPQRDMVNIFDPFFSTKKRGTGLGLTIVHHILQAHDGKIEVNSSEGRGTECVISIPLVSSSAMTTSDVRPISELCCSVEKS